MIAVSDRFILWGMTKPQLVTGLQAKRHEIAAEIERLSDALKHLDAAIGAIAGRSSAPKRQSRTNQQRGSVGRYIFDALREAQSKLSTVQIAAYVAEKIGVDISEKRAMLAMNKKVGKAIGHYRRNGQVLGERRGYVTCWRLPPT